MQLAGASGRRASVVKGAMRIALTLALLFAASVARADRCPPPTPRLGSDGKVFPSRIGPALSGELAALKWGMSVDDIDQAAPELSKAVFSRSNERASKRGDVRTYQPFRDGEIQLQVTAQGLIAIYLRYPSRAAALEALAAWKAPAAPKNAQQFEFWTSVKGRARGLLRPDDGEAFVVELLPFMPLAERMDKLLAPSGKPLLGMKKADVCLPALDQAGRNLTVAASERSSGYYTYLVTWRDERVESFLTRIDYTYDHSVKDLVVKLLTKKFGTSRKVSTSSGQRCDAYGTSPIVYACSTPGVTVWTIYVGKEP